MDIATKNEQQTKDKQLPFVLNSIEIIGLYDSMNYKFVFRDNKLVLLGENGSCKTTLLRIMCYALSGELERLREFSFDKIIIHFANGSVEIDQSLFKKNPMFSYNDDIDYFIQRSMRELRKIVTFRDNYLPSYILDEIQSGLLSKNIERLERALSEIRYSYNPDLYYELRAKIFDRIIPLLENRSTTNSEINKKRNEIQQYLKKNTAILYLPTYRRIERKISDNNSLNEIKDYYEEMKSFGMDDVNETINTECEKLDRKYKFNSRKILNFSFSSILDLSNPENNVEFERVKGINKNDLQKTIKSIDENILDKQNKTKLTEILSKVIDDIATNKKEDLSVIESFLFHTYFELEKIQLELTKDTKPIQDFISVCHHFIKNKKINFDNKNLKVEIKIANNKKIEWDLLSSGEKQIVSIFSKLYLENKKYFVFIDEPEMSLSIDWQELFLSEIIRASNCCGLVSISHSPFMYQGNELYNYTNSLNLFRTN